MQINKASETKEKKKWNQLNEVKERKISWSKF